MTARKPMRRLWVAALALMLIMTPLAAGAKEASIPDEEIPLAGSGRVLAPQNTGAVTFQGDGATLDASNMADGYVMIRYKGSAGGNSQLVGTGIDYKTVYRY